MAKNELKIKERYSKGITERRVNGFGVVRFDPSKVDPKDYAAYQKKGFDIFEKGTPDPVNAGEEGTEGKKEGKSEGDKTRAEILDAEHNKPAIIEMAKALGLEFDEKGTKKGDIIEMIVKKEIANEEAPAE